MEIYIEENGETGKKLTDYEEKSQNHEDIHWRPVSNIPVEEIYKDLPEVKEWHDAYCEMWLKKTLDR